MTPDPVWLREFAPPDRLALKCAFRDAVRQGAATVPQVVSRVRWRYRRAQRKPLDAAAGAHFAQVITVLDAYRLDVRAYAQQVLEREKKQR